MVRVRVRVRVMLRVSTEAAEQEALHPVLGDDERDGGHVRERLGEIQVTGDR